MAQALRPRKRRARKESPTLEEMEPLLPCRRRLYQRYQSHPPSRVRVPMSERCGQTLEGHLALDEFQEEVPPSK